MDDEIDICFLLSGILKRKNIAASYVNNLMDARTEMQRPDFLFLDNYWREGLGVVFIRYVKQACPATKVVVITAHDNMKEREKAMAGGASEFIGKPFTVESIHQTLEKLI